MVQVEQGRQLLQTRRAPGRPEVQQHHLAAKLAQANGAISRDVCNRQKRPSPPQVRRRARLDQPFDSPLPDFHLRAEIDGIRRYETPSEGKDAESLRKPPQSSVIEGHRGVFRGSKLLKRIGSSGRTRTYNPSVKLRNLCTSLRFEGAGLQSRRKYLKWGRALAPEGLAVKLNQSFLNSCKKAIFC